MVFIDYYKTLGVRPDASAEALKMAYRRLSKIFHPDVGGNDEEREARFKDITEAYAVLSEPKQRKLYDAAHRRASKHAVAVGNKFHLPDSPRVAQTWHPDYKPTQQISKRGNIALAALALAIFAVGGTLLFREKPLKQQPVVADAESYLAPAQQPLQASEPALQTLPDAALPVAMMDSNARRQTPDPTIISSASDVHEPILIASRAIENINAQNHRLNPVEQTKPEVVKKPAHTPVKPLQPKQSISTEMPVITVGPPMRALAVPTISPVNASLRNSARDTDLSDLMVRRVRQVQYGYIVFSVQRVYHFSDLRKNEMQTVRYISGVKVYKISDVQNQEQIIALAAEACNRAEHNAAPVIGMFTTTFAIVSQNLKVFPTQGDAASALQAEGKALFLSL